MNGGTGALGLRDFGKHTGSGSEKAERNAGHGHAATKARDAIAKQTWWAWWTEIIRTFPLLHERKVCFISFNTFHYKFL